MTTLLIAGGTGAVGSRALALALADARIARVVAPTRRPLPAHPKLENPVIDFDLLPMDAPWWAVDAVICALGTTMRKAGSREAFREVDLCYPLAVADLACRQGASTFVLVSAIGADAGSRFFYNRVKGCLEKGLEDFDFTSLTILRPSLIDVERTERRRAEQLLLPVMRALSPLLPRRYRPVSAERIAAAALDAASAGGRRRSPATARLRLPGRGGTDGCRGW